MNFFNRHRRTRRGVIHHALLAPRSAFRAWFITPLRVRRCWWLKSIIPSEPRLIAR